MHDLPFSRRRYSRRHVIGRLGGTVGAALGGFALSGLLSSCGDEANGVAPQVVGLFSSSRVIVAGREQRIPFGLVDPTRSIVDSTTVQVRVTRDTEIIDEQTVSGRIVDHDHPPGTEAHDHADLLRYYPLRTTLHEPGIYDLEISVEGHELGLPVQAFDPSEVELPLPGDPFPSVESPTFDDSLGVDPICTRFEGPCEFHDRTAADVLSRGEPMALLVATPAFCATAYCGPVLGTMIEASADFPSVTFVHVEPWANPTEGEGLTDPDLAISPTVDALKLSFEPALFLVDAGGTLVERIDNVFDSTELRSGLTLIG